MTLFRWGVGAVAAMALAACGPGKTEGGASTAKTAEPVAAASGVCGLLTLAEVKAVFPDAAASKPEESLAEQGIHACDWESASGARLVQLRVSNSSVSDEIGMFEMGVLDPTKPRKPMAREAVPGAGDGAQVVVAQQDEAQGVLQSVGVAAAQKGAKTVVIVSSDIAGRDRATAVTGLGQLVKATGARVQ